MTRHVKCMRLGASLPGLDYPPFKGELGMRIYENISQDAWKEWVRHSTMVINEKRLNPADPEAQKVLRAEMMKFLFEGGAEKPAGYVPPSKV
jgi:Fe-S cluster biosynthesis and repair protein YggX